MSLPLACPPYGVGRGLQGSRGRPERSRGRFSDIRLRWSGRSPRYIARWQRRFALRRRSFVDRPRQSVRPPPTSPTRPHPFVDLWASAGGDGLVAEVGNPPPP